jgi:hypothetical protein
MIFFSAFWSILTLFYHHPANEALESSGILFVETYGAYALARWLVRDADDFLALARALFMVIVCLLPFGLFELFTGRPVLIDFLGAFLNVYPNVPHEIRLGMDRVQGTFEHPILFGVFCSTGFALSVYVLGYNQSVTKTMIRAGTVVLSVFISLSSGPLSAIGAQVALTCWDLALKSIRQRWVILFWLFVAAYIAVDILSNRTPLEVLVSYISFNPSTGYVRILIFEYGGAEVMRNPIMGIGFHDWQRLSWMSASVDMFWLVPAMRHGLPAALSLAFGYLYMIVAAGRKKISDERIRAYRTGLVLSLVGLGLAGWGVHYWNATYCLLLFMLGSGAWILNSETAEPSTRADPPRFGRRVR